MTDKQKFLVVVVLVLAAIAAFVYNGAANRRADEDAYERFMRDCVRGSGRSHCAQMWVVGGNIRLSP